MIEGLKKLDETLAGAYEKAFKRAEELKQAFGWDGESGEYEVQELQECMAMRLVYFVLYPEDEAQRGALEASIEAVNEMIPVWEEEKGVQS